jgi:hypothetical protein
MGGGASESELALFSDGGLRVAAAARESGLSRTVLYELMGAGLLPYSKVGAARIIPRRALMNILAGQRPDGAQRAGFHPRKVRSNAHGDDDLPQRGSDFSGRVN